jgi:hypothetical protein
LYGKLVDENGLALPVDAVTTVNVYVTATIGSGFSVVKSASKEVTFNISKIGMEGDLLYIAGDFNEWSSSRAAIVGFDKVYAGYVDMNWRDHDNILYKLLIKYILRVRGATGMVELWITFPLQVKT